MNPSIAQTEQAPQVPDFGENNPPAKGIILVFKNWPLTSEQSKAILKKTRALDLKKVGEYALFKSIVFQWADWKGANEARSACGVFSGFSNILDYCEPDFFLSPALKRKKTRGQAPSKKKLNKGASKYPSFPFATNQAPSKEGPNEGSKKGPKLAPSPVSSEGSGNIVSCNIVSTQLKLVDEGKEALPGYWAQEMVGADLVKEELKKVPPIKKHLVAVFDTPWGRHDIGSKNIISSKGKESTLPEIGKSLTIWNSSHPSYNLRDSSYLQETADEKCNDKKPK